MYSKKFVISPSSRTPPPLHVTTVVTAMCYLATFLSVAVSSIRSHCQPFLHNVQCDSSGTGGQNSDFGREGCDIIYIKIGYTLVFPSNVETCL